MRRGSVPSQYPLDRGMPVFPHHGDNEPHRGQAGTAYQDNGWAIEQGLADVRALTEHWVACTVGAGAPRGVADATVALRLAYEVTFGIPVSRARSATSTRTWTSRTEVRPAVGPAGGWPGRAGSAGVSPTGRRPARAGITPPTGYFPQPWRSRPTAIDGWVCTGTPPGRSCFPAELGFIPGFVAPAWPQR